MSGFRHVVMFRWATDASAEGKAAAVAALRRLVDDLADLGTLSVGVDAGLAAGNADVVVVADFPSSDAYLAYAQDPRHVEVVVTYVRPVIAERVAVQYAR